MLDRNMGYTRALGVGYRRLPQASNPSNFQKAGPSNPYNRAGSNSSVGSVSSRPRTINRSLSPKGIEEKRAKNLCFLCDEDYFPGHKCKSQIYSLEVVEEVKDVEVEELEGEEEVVGAEQHEEPPLLSLNAINGISTYQTMRITGRVKTTPLYILIDSRSTHNFLDIGTAKRLHREINRIPPVQVMVANGQQLQCAAMCKNFSWNLLGETFVTNAMFVPLGNCEMVLGVHWLASLGPIMWDFEKLRMEFKKW